MTILNDAKLLSTKLRMRKETEGINEREKQIEYLLQSGLRQYLQEMHQSEPVISLHDSDMTNEAACDIEALILSVQLENIWQREQCSKYMKIYTYIVNIVTSNNGLMIPSFAKRLYLHITISNWKLYLQIIRTLINV